MAGGRSANAVSQSEFHRMLQDHLRDIRHLAHYCSRHGEGPDIVAVWLEDAAAQLVELAHTLPGEAKSG